MTTVAIVDYGLANIRSVVNAFDCLGAEVRLAAAGDELEGADKIVLPGVGSFDAGMRALRERCHAAALDRLVRGGGTPFLGICLGLQFLYEASAEGREPGLGWISGRLERFPEGPGNPKVPHMGWNEIEPVRESTLFASFDGPTDFYFVHSYYVPTTAAEGAAAFAEYGRRFVAAVECDNVFAVQFHPEKSQLAGMKLLENFLDL